MSGEEIELTEEQRRDIDEALKKYKVDELWKMQARRCDELGLFYGMIDGIVAKDYSESFALETTKKILYREREKARKMKLYLYNLTTK